MHLIHVRLDQGHNFASKSKGLYGQQQIWPYMGFLGGSSEPSPHQLGAWGSAVSSSSGVWGRAPVQIEFYVLFGLENVTDGDYSHFPMRKNL